MARSSAYCPARGDIVLINCRPSAGHEMDDWHYALVLSPLEYNRKTSLCVCLIGTSKRKGYPYEIDLPLDLIPRDPSRPVTDSLILCDHVRTMDWRERGAAFRAAAPTPLVEKALDYLLTLLDPYLAG